MILYLRELERRRIALAQRSGAERAAIADAVSPLARKLAGVDRVVASVRGHPLLVAVAAGALGMLGPRRLLAWGARAAAAYSLLRHG
jgi:hypothetical protein